jgi:integrase
MKKPSEYEKWAHKFETVKRLFDRLAVKKSGSKHTERIYSRSLMLWHEYSGLNPDETVAKWRKEAKADLEQALDDWDVKMDLFVNWLVKTKGFKKGVASSIHAAVKSLIKYNCRIKLSIGTPNVGIVESLKPITIEEFKKLDTIATIQQKWIIRGLKDSGMSREDFIELTYGDVKADLERGEQYIHLNVIRRKEQVKYETWLGPNAIEVLTLYLQIRRNRGETITDVTPLTVGELKPYKKLAVNSLTKLVLRLGERIGIKASPHRLRKTFETYLALEVKHPIILRYWMGHKLKMSDIEARYVIPPEPEQRMLYKNAYKRIDITQASVEDRVKALEEFKTALTPEQRELAKRAGWSLRKPKAKPKKNDCNDGTHCEFCEIGDDQLLAHLQNGYEIVHNLQNGRLIVRR